MDLLYLDTAALNILRERGRVNQSSLLTFRLPSVDRFGQRYHYIWWCQRQSSLNLDKQLIHNLTSSGAKTCGLKKNPYYALGCKNFKKFAEF